MHQITHSGVALTYEANVLESYPRESYRLYFIHAPLIIYKLISSMKKKTDEMYMKLNS